MKRLVLSSIQNFAQILIQHPSLLNIPSFMPLRPLVDKLTEDGKGCGCKKGSIYNQYKPHFESAVTGLTDSDRGTIKSLLNVEQICYYTRNKAGVLELICL
jgi:hypothetical protein